MSLDATLASGLRVLGFDTEQSRRMSLPLLQYLDLLQQWNRTYNLTAIRDPEEMLVKHVFDSLAVHPWLQCDRLIDVGSGAGLPGIPLFLCGAAGSATLIDSAGKKVRFINHVASTLKLSGLVGWHGRVESCTETADAVISRAYATPSSFCQSAGHLVAPGGRLYAMQGKLGVAEGLGLPEGYALEAAHALQVPMLDAERCLLVIKKD